MNSSRNKVFRNNNYNGECSEAMLCIEYRKQMGLIWRLRINTVEDKAELGVKLPSGFSMGDAKYGLQAKMGVQPVLSCPENTWLTVFCRHHNKKWQSS